VTDYRDSEANGPRRQPVIQITVDGVSIDSALRRRLIQLTHTDNRGFEADTVEIEFDDSDGALDIPPRGAEISLAFGWKHSGVVDKGLFTVTEVAHAGAPDVLTIRAQSADLRSGLSTQRERSFHDTTLGAIVQTIADENDLKPVVSPQLAGQHIDHLDQTNESSANLLTRLAQQFDAIATVKGGRLLFIHAGAGTTASGKALEKLVIVRQSGDRHLFQISDRNTYTAVRALYHDMQQAVKGEVIWGEAEDSAERNVRPAAAAPTTGQYKALPGQFASRAKAMRAAQKAWKAMKNNQAQRAAYVGIKASYNDRNLGSSGDITYGKAEDDKKRRDAQRLSKKDAAKLQADEKPVPFGPMVASADSLKTLRHVYSSRTNAARAARAEWRRLQRGLATFSLTLAYGIPELFPETPAEVSGWKPRIDSTEWIAYRITNRINDSGYTQQVELEIKATEIPD
jgi:phage protein D